MSDLIVVTYPDKYRAAEVMATLDRLQVEHLIDLEDACYVTKDNEGTVKLHQAVNLTANGALSGGFWGMLIGMLFFNPLLGGLIGAGAGALSGAASDYGISDDFIHSLAEQMQTDSSGIFVLVTKITPDKVLDEMSKFGGTVLRTSFTREVEAQWQTALSGRENTLPS
jgi:uncharacterized membrane protein